jgi:hypothetical protein
MVPVRKKQQHVSAVFDRVAFMLRMGADALVDHQQFSVAIDWTTKCVSLLEIMGFTTEENNEFLLEDGVTTQISMALAAMKQLVHDLGSSPPPGNEANNPPAAAAGQNKAGSSSAVLLSTTTTTTTVVAPPRKLRFDDIVGYCGAKQQLYENVVLPLTLSAEVKAQLFGGIRSGSGNVILHGPPGTGKTILCQAAAEEAGAVLINIRPSDILSKYQVRVPL